MQEAAVIEGDVGIVEIGMAAGRRFEGDDGMGVSDDGDVRHGSS
jgi:hypothetical protein